MKKIYFIVIILITFSSSVNAQIKSTPLICSCCRVEIAASFPGGEKAWKFYLENNFRKEEVACQMPFNGRSYTQAAIIFYKIDKGGNIVEAGCYNQNLINPVLQKEALRLILNSPRWIPGQENGRYVNAFRKDTISITVVPFN